MNRFDVWLDRFAKVSCIGSLISQVVFGLLGLRALSQAPPPTLAAPTDHRPLYYFLAWLVSILYSITMGYFIFGRKTETNPRETDDSTGVEKTDFRQDEQQDQFLKVREERDKLRSELDHLKAQKPDTTVRDSDPQLEIKFVDLLSQTGSNDQVCFHLINNGRYSPAKFACIEDFYIGGHHVALRTFPPPIAPFGNYDSINNVCISNPDGKPSRKNIFSVFHDAWDALKNPNLYALPVPLRFTYQDDASNLFEGRCDLVYYPVEHGKRVLGKDAKAIEVKNIKLRKVAAASTPVDWSD